MFSRRSLPALLAIMVFVGAVSAEDRVQSELKFVAHTKAEMEALRLGWTCDRIFVKFNVADRDC